MNNFTEYTMVSPKSLATYFGFTEEEAEGICRRYGCDMGPIRRWYDGYRMELPPGGAGRCCWWASTIPKRPGGTAAGSGGHRRISWIFI